MTKCKVCEGRESFAEHHFDGEEIHLKNLSNGERKKYKSLEDSHNEVIEVCTICHSKIHGNIAKWNPIKLLYKLRKDIIKERKATKSRIRALKEYELDVSDLKEVAETLTNKEKKLSKRLKKLVREEDIWDWLEKVKGIGEINTAGLIAKLNFIEKYETVSSLWKFCGLMPKNGFDEEDSNFENYTHYRQATKEERTLTAYDIGECFVRNTECFYRKFYDLKKEEYLENRDWSDGHCHAAARRYAVKMFLSHLWSVWRQMKGLEITDPYILSANNGHNRKVEPPHKEEIFNE